MPNVQDIISIAKEAGFIIISHYYKENISVKTKPDSSPVTEADLESNDFICKKLTRLYPEIPIISEEQDNLGIETDFFWSIDPLDGTRAFLQRNGEFTVNIALIRNKTTILGIVYSPLTKELYFVDQNKKPYKERSDGSVIPIQSRSMPNERAIILISSSSGENKKLHEYIKKFKNPQIIPSSSAMKICKIAEGSADIYPRFGKTMEWDTAAGHAILNAAGGRICDLSGNELTYGHSGREFTNPDFIAIGKH
ncbi:MAG: 3'(2'),5'-bisphosphate nucleotidase CysQ [Pseudomonadota bacterium]